MVVNLPRGNQVQVVGRPTQDNSRRLAQSSQSNAEAFSSNADNITTGVAQPDVLPIATTTSLGVVQPDGTTITVDPDGVIHSVGAGGAFHPGYVAGAYYGPPGYGATNSALSTSATVLYFTAFYVGVSQTFTKATVVCSTVSGTVHVTMGLYANTSGQPSGSPLFNFGDIGPISSSGSGGFNTISGLTIPLAPGWYWLAIGSNASCSLKGIGAGNLPSAWFQGYTPTTFPVGYQQTWTYSAGNLPTIGTLSNSAGVVPTVLLSY